MCTLPTKLSICCSRVGIAVIYSEESIDVSLLGPFGGSLPQYHDSLGNGNLKDTLLILLATAVLFSFIGYHHSVQNNKH